MKPPFVIAYYNIEYQNGFEQAKGLISRKSYETILKVIDDKIHEIDCREGLTRERIKELQKPLKARKKMLFGEEWFVEESPLHEAILTSIIDLPPQQGGSRYCKVCGIGK